MSTTSGSRNYGRFDELAEEFAERYRRGERPSVQEYVDRLPEMADEIREMFPALVEVEQVDELLGGRQVGHRAPFLARITASCATDATRRPSWEKTRASTSARPDDAEGETWS